MKSPVVAGSERPEGPGLGRSAGMEAFRGVPESPRHGERERGTVLSPLQRDR